MCHGHYALAGAEVFLGGGFDLLLGDGLIFFVVFFTGLIAKAVEFIEAAHRGEAAEVLAGNFFLTNDFGFGAAEFVVGETVLPKLSRFGEQFFFHLLKLLGRGAGVE